MSFKFNKMELKSQKLVLLENLFQNNKIYFKQKKKGINLLLCDFLKFNNE